MRTTLTLALGLSLVLSPSPVSAQSIHLWSYRHGGTGVDNPVGMAVDGSGNVVIVGAFSGTTNLGGLNLASVGGNDIFLAKYDANGAHQWSKRLGGTGADAGYAVAVDGSGNVMVSGFFSGTVNFGGSNLASAGGTDIFLAKYNANGVHQWSQRFGSTSGDTGYGIAVDPSGNVVLTGAFTGVVDFGGGNLTSAGSQDIVLAKYNANGVHQWSQRFGNTSGDTGYGVAVDASGNVAATGNFQGTVDFGGGNLTTAGSGGDVYVAKYDAVGTHQWSQRFGSTSTDIGEAIAVDGSGNVLVTGRYAGTVDFGDGNHTAAGAVDVFVAKYNSGGTNQWSLAFGSTGNDIPTAVATDGSGNVVVAGEFDLTVDFGGGNLTSAGGSDVFVAKYDAGGVHQWSESFGSTSNDVGNAVATDPTGNVIAAGPFQGTVDFGGGSFVSAGSSDVFLAKYASYGPNPVITSITDIGNDQGRQVHIRFASSTFDTVASPTPILQYEAYRRNDPAPSAATAWPGGATFSKRELLADGWTEVGDVAAHGETFYGIVVPTIADSTVTAGQYNSTFYIRAATSLPLTYFDSLPDSGYSLDNLAPEVPGGFVFAARQLAWDESGAADFDHFSVYGSNAVSFGSATLVGYTRETSLDVGDAAYAYYFVTATDLAGNEGKPAMVDAPDETGATPKNYVLSISAYPNPFNPETTFRYTVPSKGRVTIDVFDLRGARVATLVDAEKDVGAHTIAWDGRDHRGNPVGSGVYFGRLTSSAGQRSYKLTLLK